MNQFMNWFAMGKYSLYVWSSYALFTSIFLIHFFAIKWQRRRLYNELQQWFKR